MLKLKKLLKKCKGKNNHKTISVMIVMIIIILLVSTTLRAVTLYNQYRLICPEGKIDHTLIDKIVSVNNKNLFNMIINEGYNNAVKRDKISTDKLQSDLLANHSKYELEEVLNSVKYHNYVYTTIDNANNNYFQSSFPGYVNFLVIGTEDKILYAKANDYYDKFKNMLGTESYISWKMFYDTLNNPTMTKTTFEDIKNSNITNTTIMRIDGKYKDNRLYTTKDLYDIYRKKGLNGLTGFGFVTLTTITEDGDILGNKDSNFMRRNENCKKMYVYHYMDIREYIINNVEKMMEQNLLNDKYTDTIDKQIINSILFSLSTILFNIISIIGLMFVYKSLEEVNE